jgi:hypothetical protein
VVKRLELLPAGIAVLVNAIIMGPVFAAPSLSMDQRIEAASEDFRAFDRAHYERPDDTIIELSMPIRPIICVRPIVDIVPPVSVETKIGKNKRAQDN